MNDTGRRLTFFCHSVTPFDESGAIDEAELRRHLRRLVAAGNGIFLGSPGAGESSALTVAELRRVYEIGVEEAKGKAPLYASTREARSAEAMYEVASAAAVAGVDVVQLHQLDGGHGMVPTETEQDNYFSSLLSSIHHPVAISVHSALGYVAPPSLLRSLSDRYDNLCGVSIVGPPSEYFMKVRDALPGSVELLSGGSSFMHNFMLGASGTQSPHANLLPKTYRAIGDAYSAGDHARATALLQQYTRVVSVLAASGSGAARALKLAMKSLGLGNGVLRPPYLPSGEDAVARMRAALVALGIPELMNAQPGPVDER
jgi:4-hydroxy-tetrahydrodipicolinate synthase